MNDERSLTGLIAGLILVLSLAAVGPASADVVVVAEAENSSQVITHTGTIVDYTGRELKLRTAGGTEWTFPASRVRQVETRRHGAHDEGIKLFAANKPDAALAQFRTALEAEPRAWVKREILAQVVWSHRRLRQWEAAGTMFLKLATDDPTTPHYDCIPLVWRGADAADAPSPAAEKWLADANNPIAVLLGASHLLAAGNPQAPLAALRRLTRDRDLRIANLADAQSWRVALAGATPDEIARRRSVVEKLPSPLRAGPYFVLGQTLAQRDECLMAILAYLRLPIEHREHRELAAASLREAADLAQKLGYREEVARLLDELAREYPDLPEAKRLKIR
jgi:hypothetical protein